MHRGWLGDLIPWVRRLRAWSSRKRLERVVTFGAITAMTQGEGRKSTNYFNKNSGVDFEEVLREYSK